MVVTQGGKAMSDRHTSMTTPNEASRGQDFTRDKNWIRTLALFKPKFSVRIYRRYLHDYVTQVSGCEGGGPRTKSKTTTIVEQVEVIVYVW